MLTRCQSQEHKTMSHFSGSTSPLHTASERWGYVLYPQSPRAETINLLKLPMCSIVPHAQDWSVVLMPKIPRLWTVSPGQLMWSPDGAFAVICYPHSTDIAPMVSSPLRSTPESVLHISWELDELVSLWFWAGHWCGVNSMLIRLKHNADCLVWNEPGENPLRRLLMQQRQWTMALLLAGQRG